MKTYYKIILVFASVYIFISACFTFIPIGKYQSAYFKFIKDFRNKPQEHFDKQIEYANYIEQNGKLPPEILKYSKNKCKTSKPVKELLSERQKPKFIRDKNNPKILHPFKSRKFLFFRIYYK